MPYTRMYMPEKPDYGFLLPEGMKAEVLSRYPCIQMSDGNILCSADNGDGTFSPVVLNGQNMEEKSIYVGEPIQAVALIPFWIVKPVEGMGTAKYTRVGGYIVSKRMVRRQRREMEQNLGYGTRLQRRWTNLSPHSLMLRVQ